MSIRGAFATIVGCTLLLAGVGAGVGYGLGVFAPDYYRGVFARGREPGFDPVSVGVGQGVTQGTAGGVAVGVALVAIFCWRQTQLDRLARPPADPPEPQPTWQSTARRVLLALGGLLVLGFCTGSGVFAWVLIRTTEAYHSRYLEERDALAPVLAGDPAFAGVEVHEYSGGGVYLSGEVPTAADLGRLKGHVEQAVGADRAKMILYGVSVRR